VTRRLKQLAIVTCLALMVGGCAAGRAFRQGNVALRAGDLDGAVAFYRVAVQADPDNPNYKIALERAMMGASRAHLERAREFEAMDQLDAARSEYRLASEYDPSNLTAAAKVAALDQTIRERNEAARPRPPIEDLRARARAAAAPPTLNPVTESINLRFTAANLRDILTFLADQAGINIVYDRDARPEAISTTIDLQGVTVGEALNQLLTYNQLAYKVLSDRSILIFPDTTAKRTQYEDQVVQTFYLSHADATELSQLIGAVIRLPGMAVIPQIQANKTGNTLIVRGTRPVVEIIEKIIAQNDKPRAEIVFDLEILEVDRARVKQYGLNLSEYALGGIFSPEVSPAGTTTATPAPGTPTTPTTGTTTGRSTPPTTVQSPPPFNLNTISQGVNTSDFYLAVPTAFVRFLESDTTTKLIAKPQLRGVEGTKLTLNLGDEIPIVSTSYTPIATGGAGVNPLNSFQLKPVGINIDITPRVTLEGDVLIELYVESSSRGADVNVAGTNYPSFGSRKVTTKLRLRDGEPNLLAGLLREDERRSLAGFPGAIRVPVLRQLFSANDANITQTDIVMLLTPHIVRTQGITEADLRPIYIGTQGNLGLGGPPPLIAAPEEPAPAPAPPAAAVAPPAGAATPRPPAAAPGAPPTGQPPALPGGATVALPPGTTPVPGTVLVPAEPPPAGPAPASAAGAATPAPPATAAPAAGTPPPGSTPAEPAVMSPGFGLAQVILSPPPVFRVGGGPYTVPISVTNVSRLSTIALTLTFDPALLRVRTVQEGSFMRTGGAKATFTQQVSPGRVDITIVRDADATGATGTGLLGAILLDALAPGMATLTVSGAAGGPGGTPMGLQFQPARVNIQ
jgi:type II secretory pathway component GspD/PulD (secretin)